MQEERGELGSEDNDVATVVWLSLGLLALVFVSWGSMLAEIVRNQQALRWPTTEGRVAYRDAVEADPGTEGSALRFRVHYEYQVDGRQLSARSSLGPWSRETAERWVHAYPPGTVVQVYYDPKKPLRSAVWPEVQARWTLSRVQGVLPFVLVVLPGAGLLALLFWLRYHTDKASSAPPAKAKALRRW